MWINYCIFAVANEKMIGKMKYQDEKDKCYGVVGMAIGLTIWDAEDMFSHISLDGDGFDCISFTQDYYFAGNPTFSAKSAWNAIFERYKIILGLSLSNVMCRSIVEYSQNMSSNTKQMLLKAFIDEGAHSCQLDEDEVRRLFDKSYSYLSQLYMHQRVHAMVNKFVADLKERRTMTRDEVAEYLGLLG